MKRASFASFLLLLVATASWADIPNRPRQAIEEAVAPHGGGGARPTCSIVYYNICSGWFWCFSGWQAGDEAGVVFDLPEDCGNPVFGWYRNTHFWWYWRCTAPTYGYTVSYNLYNLDASLCKSGASIGSITGYDPVERWNYHLGLGTVTSDFGGLIASWDAGTLPRFCTDNANANYSAPVACPGYAEGVMHTLYWGGATTQYCPPQYFAVGGYRVQCVMDAGWTDWWVSTEPASWSSVKKLFR